MILTIRNSPSARPAAPARRSGGVTAGQAYSGTAPAAAGEAPAPKGVASAQALTSLDAVMALQGVDDPAGRKARALRRGARLLDDLDGLRLGLLEGRLSEGRLGSLLSLVASGREGSGDDGLEEVLDGIELRARVELAKLGR